MFKLDDNLLKELGLGSLSPSDKNRMLGHIYETLEMRVGMKLAEKMTNQQLDEFEAFIDKNDEAGALKWLETNFPNYKQVVADELEALKVEIKQSAPQILVASQQQAAQPQGGQVMQPQFSQPTQPAQYQPQYQAPPAQPYPPAPPAAPAYGPPAQDTFPQAAPPQPYPSDPGQQQVPPAQPYPPQPPTQPYPPAPPSDNSQL
jgi:D-Tyr-tRNAtyr deacylase